MHLIIGMKHNLKMCIAFWFTVEIVAFSPLHWGLLSMLAHMLCKTFKSVFLNYPPEVIGRTMPFSLVHHLVVPINSLQQFRVLTHGAGVADIAVTITTPSGTKIGARVEPSPEGFLVSFTPVELGEYLLSIAFGGAPLATVPHRVFCTPGVDPSKVVAYGPGLTGGTVFYPAEFTVNARAAGRGSLGVTVEGPAEAAINCRDLGDGTCAVAYLPVLPGLYGINITFDGRHILGSPFRPVVRPLSELNQIHVSGVGIQPHGGHLTNACLLPLPALYIVFRLLSSLFLSDLSYE